MAEADEVGVPGKSVSEAPEEDTTKSDLLPPPMLEHGDFSLPRSSIPEIMKWSWIKVSHIAHTLSPLEKRHLHFDLISPICSG